MKKDTMNNNKSAIMAKRIFIDITLPKYFSAKDLFLATSLTSKLLKPKWAIKVKKLTNAIAKEYWPKTSLPQTLARTTRTKAEINLITILANSNQKLFRTTRLA